MSISSISTVKDLLKAATKELKPEVKEVNKALGGAVSAAREVVEVNRDCALFHKIALVFMSVLLCFTVIVPYKAIKAFKALNKQQQALQIGRAEVTQNLQGASNKAGAILDAAMVALSKKATALRGAQSHVVRNIALSALALGAVATAAVKYAAPITAFAAPFAEFAAKLYA